MLPRIVVKVKKPFTPNPDLELKESISRNLRKSVDEMVELASYSFGAVSSRMRLMNKKYKLHINEISQGSNSVRFGSTIGDIQFILTNTSTSTAKAYIDGAFKNLFTLAEREKFDTYCDISVMSRPFVNIITNSMRSSHETSQKVYKLLDELTANFKELFGKYFEDNPDDTLSSCTQLLYNLYICLPYHQRYIRAYNTSKHEFLTLYDLFREHEYRYQEIIFLITPVRAATMSRYQYLIMAIAMYDDHHK